MASWYSKILTTTTTQISNLQSRLLQSDADGDTEDDTHVCRVLRAYYTEQGRPFPPWLPPDPKAPPPPAPVYSQPQVGSRYGGLGAQQSNASAGSGLSSLWSNTSTSNVQQDGGSLRPGRTPLGGAQPPTRPSPFSQNSGRSDVQARPLPSQRAGSYQTSNLYNRDSSGSTPPGSSAGGGSAQERLKQKLWGGGARTTSPQSGNAGPFRPPQGGGYGSGAGAGSARGSGGSYEDRFAPGGMYEGGGNDRPFVAANAPWASNESEFTGGGGGGGGGRSGGLPSGPRRGGLPSGPRRR